MGCIYTKKQSPPPSPQFSGPLDFDKDLSVNGINAPFYEKLGQQKQAYIVSVYDGDTFTAAIKIDGQVVRVKCRINGIDCPEMKPLRSKENRDEEIALAKQAKKIVSTAILEKYIKLNISGLDKYGRFLVNISDPDTGKNIADMLLEKNLAYKYDGGTKKSF